MGGVPAVVFLIWIYFIKLYPSILYPNNLFLGKVAFYLVPSFCQALRPAEVCLETEMRVNTNLCNTKKNDPSVQFSSVAQSCPTLCDPMNCSMPGLPVHHQLLEFTHVHWVGDAIQSSHPLSSPSPPAPNPSHHQGLFLWVNSAWVGQITRVSASA